MVRTNKFLPTCVEKIHQLTYTISLHYSELSTYHWQTESLEIQITMQQHEKKIQIQIHSLRLLQGQTQDLIVLMVSAPIETTY